MKHDEYINEWSQRTLRGCCFPCEQAEKVQPRLLHSARQQMAQAKASALPEACLRILECKMLKKETAMKQAQPMGQRMDQARARFRRAVESKEKAMQALQKAQENFEQAQQEVMQAQTELEKLMQEAPLPVMPVPQVNMSMVKSLEALTGIIENLWNPDAGPPPDDLVHAIQESRQILQTFSGYPVPGVWCSLGCRVGRRTGSRVTGPRRGRSRGDGGLRRGTCSRRAAGGGEAGTQSRGRTRTPMTSPQQKKTRTTELDASEKGGTQLS